MRPPVLAVAVLAFSASGCVNGFVCSRNGGARWRELTTEHFVLRTDHGPETARALALELERLRDAVATGLLESPPKTGPRVQVMVSIWRSQWALFSPPGADGLFTISSWGEPTILLPAELGHVQRTVIAHELAHMLTAVDGARQPPWYREGLATYAESVRFVGDGGNVMMGDVTYLRSLTIPEFHGNMRAVLAEREALGPGGYALAWVLVHFLITEHPDRLGALEERFARGEDPAAAWRAVFPEWDPESPEGAERLEGALSAYASRPAKAYVFPHRGLASIPPPSERMLSSAEVHDVRLSLPWPNQGRGVPQERVLAEAREALAEDAGCPTAVALLASEPGADARALAERATQARPQDARNWVLLGHALPSEDVAGREAAFRRAVATDAESPAALTSLAGFLVEQRRAREALAPARRAVELAPWSPLALDEASAVLEALGSCASALALEERAVDVARHASDRLRKPLVDRRDRLRRACGDARGRPTPSGTRYFTPNSPRTTDAIASGVPTDGS